MFHLPYTASYLSGKSPDFCKLFADEAELRSARRDDLDLGAESDLRRGHVCTRREGADPDRRVECAHRYYANAMCC